jgi:hypothetical protein
MRVFPLVSLMPSKSALRSASTTPVTSMEQRGRALGLVFAVLVMVAAVAV